MTHAIGCTTAGTGTRLVTTSSSSPVVLVLVRVGALLIGILAVRLLVLRLLRPVQAAGWRCPSESLTWSES
eukprot:2700067-Rhodomonas_salina.3